jgi:farnesyl diphosphate synthase
MEALSGFGEEIGLAFQVADDVLDVTGTSDELGKTAGRDEALQKSTFVRLLGVDGARAEAARLARRATEQLAAAGIGSPSLLSLADYIVNRRS